MPTIIEIITNFSILTLFYHGCAYLCFTQTFFTHKNFKHENVWKLCTHLTSSLHAFFCTLSAVLYLTSIFSVDTFRHFISFTTSYALFDMIILTYHQSLSLPMLIHHTLLCCATIFPFPPNLYPYGAYCYLGEFSNLFLNKTWFYLHYVPQNMDTIKSYSILTLSFYTICRIINFLYIIHISFIHQLYLFTSLMIIIYGLNIHWYILLIKKIIPILFKKKII